MAPVCLLVGNLLVSPTVTRWQHHIRSYILTLSLPCSVSDQGCHHVLLKSDVCRHSPPEPARRCGCLCQTEQFHCCPFFNFAAVFHILCKRAAKLQIKGDEITSQVSILEARHHAGGGELKAAKSFFVMQLIE